MLIKEHAILGWESKEITDATEGKTTIIFRFFEFKNVSQEHFRIY